MKQLKHLVRSSVDRILTLPVQFAFFSVLGFVFINIIALVPGKRLRSWDGKKNEYHGRSAVLCATGPSLKDQDLNLISGMHVYSVSNFFIHRQLNSLNIKMHFFAPYHEPLVYDDYVSWLNAAHSALPTDVEICLEKRSQYMVRKEGLFPGRKVNYVRFWPGRTNFEIDLQKSIPSPQTSPLMVLPVLFYLGYKKIYLVGCDHNILKDYGGTVKNFYSTDEEMRRNATSGHNWKDGIVKHLYYATKVFEQYRFLQDYANRRGIKIYNCSPDSWLDFVEYVEIERVSDENN